MASMALIMLLVLLLGCKRGEQQATQEQSSADVLPAEQASETIVSPSLEERVPDGAAGNTSEAVIQEQPTSPVNEIVNETSAQETVVEAAGNETQALSEIPTPSESGVGVTVMEEKTTLFDPVQVSTISQVDTASWFTDVRCAVGTEAEEAGYTSNVQSDDAVTFTLTNKDAHDFYLSIEKPEDSHAAEGMKLTINGRRVRGAEEKCGSSYVNGGEGITCSDVRTVIKSGTNINGQAYSNKLEATTRYFKTELIFTCGEQ